MALQELRNSFSMALNAIVSPNNNDNTLGVKQALVFYYRALPIPVLAVILISGLDLALAQFRFTAPTFWSPSLSDSSGFGSSGSIYTPVFAVACLLLYPVPAIINAAIIQLVSKQILRIWSGRYAKTFAAVMFGLLPVALCFWILSIPLANLPVDAVTNLLFFAMGLWSAVVTIFSLAAQHGITRKRASVGFMVGMIVVFFTMTFYYNFAITTTITLNTIKAIFG